MKRHLILSALVGLIVVGMLGEAFALDGWRDRRGMYAGVMIGGGSAKTDQDNAKSQLGYHMGLRVGGGVSKTLTLDASLNLRLESYDTDIPGTAGSVETSAQTFNFSLGANYFVYQGLYVRGVAGLSQFAIETGGRETDETGLAVGGGLGYEFFAGSDLAVGVGGDFQHQMYDGLSINVISVGITATWY